MAHTSMTPTREEQHIVVRERLEKALAEAKETDIQKEAPPAQKNELVAEDETEEVRLQSKQTKHNGSTKPSTNRHLGRRARK